MLSDPLLNYRGSLKKPKFEIFLIKETLAFNIYKCVNQGEDMGICIFIWQSAV